MFDDDETISTEVQNLLDRNLSLPRGAVSVDVQNGWVILTGQVDWDFQRTAAEAGIMQWSGARGILNEVSVLTTADVDDELECGGPKRRAA